MRDASLWSRLALYPFDAAGGTARFVDKLCEEEGWSRKYSLRVVEEYRRFLYLTQVSDEEAAPSWVVDRAWRLHMTFSRDYWNGLCGELFGRPLHHEPDNGSEDRLRHSRRYAATRALYAEEFGITPPKRVWRPPEYTRLMWVGGAVLALGVFLAVTTTGSEGTAETHTFLAGFGMIVVGVIMLNLFAHPVGHRRAYQTGSGGGG